MLFNFPRDYQDASRLVAIAEAEDGELVSICGTVEEVELRNTGPGKTYLGVLVKDDTEHLRAVWFNQPYMQRRFFNGQRLVLTGTVNINGLRPEMHHPAITQLGDDEAAGDGSILPVYPLTEGLRQHQMRKIATHVVDEYGPLLEETFDDAFRGQHNLLAIEPAIRGVHFPSDEEHLESARRRFIYQELLVLQLALALRKRSLETDFVASRLTTTALIDARIRDRLSFDLTEDQQQAVKEITADMDRAVPMNRLLHGEVGSGKTAVAVYAMLVAVAGGHQAAVMAPTEVLARQHWRTLNELLNPAQANVQGGVSTNAPSRVRLTLLTGSITAAQRRDALAAIAAGETDIVVGTHAVVSADVQFANLGLVVIDEQHKFGVRQRAMLRQGSKESSSSGRGHGEGSTFEPSPPGRRQGEGSRQMLPHTLLMTATPIPRTVTMSLFGDLDVSTLRHAPPGRQPVNTYVISPGDAENTLSDSPHSRGRWWDFFRQKLREGRQGYVVAPVIEQREVSASDGPHPGPLANNEEGVGEGDTRDNVASVAAAFENLSNGELADFRVDLIHGRLNPAEKQAAMDAFVRGDTQVLIATSVVEVGVDVPNATVMTIEDGHRFGLAQLHQLRGRVSRGTQPGYVCIFANTEDAEAIKRVAALAETTDGFALAELDFQMRGPGDLLGTKQHGMPPLMIADLHRDTDVLEETRTDAWALVNDQAAWKSDNFARLREMVHRRYGKSLALGDVG